jgi:hypothetical protein
MATASGTMASGGSLTIEERLAREPALRLDTRTIVGALLLAVAFSATMQITERLDQIWTGGIGVPLGHTFATVWWPVSVIYFGLTGALLTSNFNPILAVMSATHPLAWSFFFLNMSDTVPMFFMFRWYLRNRGPLTFIPFIVIVSIADLCASIVQAIALSVMVLKLSPEIVLGLFVWQWAMATLIGGPIGYYVYKSFSRAGVFG